MSLSLCILILCTLYICIGSVHGSRICETVGPPGCISSCKANGFDFGHCTNGRSVGSICVCNTVKQSPAGMIRK